MTISLLDAFLNIGMKVPHIVEEWRRVGARVDIRRAVLQRKFIESRIREGEALLAQMLGPLFNPNSPQQVAALLYDKWNLPRQYNEVRKGREVKRALTTDNEARKRLRKYCELNAASVPRPAAIFLNVQDYLEGERAKLSFLDRISPDFRIHASFRPHGTTSYRMSSVPNFQNWPIYDVTKWGGARRDTEVEKAEIPVTESGTEGGLGSLRSIVIADDDESVLVSSDFEQIEVWCYAVQTKCKWLLGIYERHEYLYGVVYEDFFKLPDGSAAPFFQAGKPKQKRFKLPEMSEKYLRRAKAIPLGFLYGRSAAAVAEEHGWYVSEAETYRRQWFARCYELEASYARDRYELEQRGWIKYPFGHIIHYPTRKPTEAYAMRGQNPAAGMLLTSIVKIDEAFEHERSGGCTLKSDGNRMVLSVHDSITSNLKRARVADIVDNIITPILTRHVPELDNFQFRASCEVGWRWDWETQDYADWKLANESGTVLDAQAEPGRASHDRNTLTGG